MFCTSACAHFDQTSFAITLNIFNEGMTVPTLMCIRYHKTINQVYKVQHALDQTEYTHPVWSGHIIYKNIQEHRTCLLSF